MHFLQKATSFKFKFTSFVVAKSPMFTHVTMTVQGLTTIRALKAEYRVLDQFEKIQVSSSSK